MYINIQFTVMGEAIKTALKFFNRDFVESDILKRNNIIDQIDITKWESINNILKLSLNNFSKKGSLGFKRNKNDRSVLDSIFGWEIIDVVVYTLRSNNDPEISKGTPITLHISFDMIVSNSVMWVESEKFKIDLLNKKWSDPNGLSGDITIRDNNVPLCINTDGNIFDRKYMTTDLDKRILLSLALMTDPFFQTPFIDFDVIDFAREQCLNLGIVDLDDLDYIDNEVKFLLMGKQYEISI